jgi:quercetin dioxygenase-like cupin family protein
MQFHRFPPLVGSYALATVPPVSIAGVTQALSGLVRFAAGKRSPDEGMRTSAVHELGYVVRGRVRIDTAHQSLEARAGDILVSSPTEPHSTTALEDSEIFFVLIDPQLPSPA